MAAYQRQRNVISRVRALKANDKDLRSVPRISKVWYSAYHLHNCFV